MADQEGRWITVNGHHIFLGPEGSTGLSPKHKDAVKEYTSGMYGSKIGGYTTINTYLRTGTNPPNITAQNITDNHTKDVVTALDEAIGQSKGAAGRTLYRGIKVPEKEVGKTFDKIKPGDTYTSQGYTSTSTSQDVIKKKFSSKLNSGETPITIKIQTEADTPSIDLKHVAEDNHEKEVILPRNTTFEVISKSGKTLTVRVKK